MATDIFSSFADAPSAPSRLFSAVAPNDTTDLTRVPKALFIGTAGDLKLIGVDAPDNATGIVFKNVAAGSILDVRVRRVLATGTTAADIIALF